MLAKLIKMKNKKGFTLVELIVVIAIIGVLSAVLVPMMGSYLTKAKVASMDSLATIIKNAMVIKVQEMDARSLGLTEDAEGTVVGTKAHDEEGLGLLTITPGAGLTEDDFKGNVPAPGTKVGLFTTLLMEEFKSSLAEQRNALVFVISFKAGRLYDVRLAEEAPTGTTSFKFEKSGEGYAYIDSAKQTSILTVGSAPKYDGIFPEA